VCAISGLPDIILIFLLGTPLDPALAPIKQIGFKIVFPYLPYNF